MSIFARPRESACIRLCLSVGLLVILNTSGIYLCEQTPTFASLLLTSQCKPAMFLALLYLFYFIFLTWKTKLQNQPWMMSPTPLQSSVTSRCYCEQQVHRCTSRHPPLGGSIVHALITFLVRLSSAITVASTIIIIIIHVMLQCVSLDDILAIDQTLLLLFCRHINVPV